jgi:hypothetical protein
MLERKEDKVQQGHVLQFLDHFLHHYVRHPASHNDFALVEEQTKGRAYNFRADPMEGIPEGVHNEALEDIHSYPWVDTVGHDAIH